MTIIVLNIFYLLSIFLVSVSVVWLLIRGNKNRTTYAFASGQFLCCFWCLGQILWTQAVTNLQMTLAFDVSYFSICFIGSALLLFGFYYNDIKIKLRQSLALFIFPTVSYIMMVTNPLHHLFYKKLTISKMVYGPVLYMVLFYTYFCTMMCVALTVRKYMITKKNKRQMLSVLVMAVLPVVFNILHMTGLVETKYDITPLAFAASTLIILVATYKYSFLNVNALAFDKIFKNISEGVLICGKNDRITYVNEFASGLLKVEVGDDNAAVDDVIGNDEKLVINERCYMIKRYQQKDKKNNIVSTIIIINDMTEYEKLVEKTRELSVSNQKLAVERERNRIAQQVHDTTGHTLTMIQSLVSMTSIEYEKGENEHIAEYLSKAKKLASGGVKELRCAINDMKQFDGESLVTQRISQLVSQIDTLDIEMCVKGTDDTRYSYLSEVIYESVRESITNCIRYGEATHMDVVLKFCQNEIDVYVFDDGRGCDKIVEGHGLNGIRERVERANGKVSFASEAGGGFRIIMKIPVEDID